jgi:hypothetical protein
VATRYRCTACGNVTKFDTAATAQVLRLISGLQEREKITGWDDAICHWCGNGDHLETAEEGEQFPSFFQTQ